MDHTRCQWTTSGGFPDKVPRPNNQDPLARSHQELRDHSVHWSRSCVGCHHMPPELRLRSHCKAFWRHASPPSTPVSCRSDSRPSLWPNLEASPRPSQQSMDWLATQGNNNTPPADLWRRSSTHGHSGVTLWSSSTTHWRRRRWLVDSILVAHGKLW